MKYLTVAEFRVLGLLQEVNRQFFHPLGLALGVDVAIHTETESFTVCLIDCRDDPEGMLYSWAAFDANDVRTKAGLVEVLRRQLLAGRIATGEVNIDGVQLLPPVPDPHA